MVQKIAHTGICVKSIDEYLTRMGLLIGAQEYERVILPERNQISAMVRIGLGNDFFELMEPTGPGAVADFLEKRGEGIHHLSFRVDDVEASCRDFEAGGFRIIGKSTGIAFVHPKTAFGVLYELIDDSYQD